MRMSVVRSISFRSRTFQPKGTITLVSAVCCWPREKGRSGDSLRGKKPRVSYPFACRQNSENSSGGLQKCVDRWPDGRRFIFGLSYAKRTLLVSDLSLSKLASIAIRYDLRQFPKVKARTPQTAPGVQGPATHFHSRLLLVTVNRVHRKRRYTDCKILCSLGPRCAVTDPLAFVGDNGLPAPNVDRSA
jgi:hypothetical protein